MQMQILKYVHIKIRKGSKEKSSDHSWAKKPLFFIKYILYLSFGKRYIDINNYSFIFVEKSLTIPDMSGL